REAAVRVEQLTAERDGAERAVQAARDAALAAADAEHTVRGRWIRGMAGSLAAELRPGDPCAVCGGTEHPAPAALSPEHATVEEVEAGGDRRQRAGAALAAAREEQAQVEARLRAAVEVAGGPGLADATAALAAAEQDLADAREAVRLA